MGFLNFKVVSALVIVVALILVVISMRLRYRQYRECISIGGKC